MERTFKSIHSFLLFGTSLVGHCVFVSAWVRLVTRSVGMDVLRSLLQFSAPVVIKMSSLEVLLVSLRAGPRAVRKVRSHRAPHF